MTLKLFQPGQDPKKETSFMFPIPVGFQIIEEEGKGAQVTTNPLPPFPPINAFIAHKALDLAKHGLNHPTCALKFKIQAPLIMEFYTDMAMQCTQIMLQDIKDHPEQYQEQVVVEEKD